ncbi:MAG: sulfotransferase [Balneolales bacterium]
MTESSFPPVSLVPTLSQTQLPKNACHRLFILGVGRSGTSLLAGLFRKTGLYMGSSSYLNSNANPRGYYEDREVNSINEDLIQKALTERKDKQTSCNFSCDFPSTGQRWLARLQQSSTLQISQHINERIDRLYSQGPSCFKDPRFNYTLQAWLTPNINSEMNNSAFLCVFRNPSKTITSILKEVNTASYLQNFSMNAEQAYDCWELQYRNILNNLSSSGRWLFIEYEDLLEHAALDRIEAFTGHKVDRSLPERSLNRSIDALPAPQQAVALYDALRERALKQI